MEGQMDLIFANVSLQDSTIVRRDTIDTIQNRTLLKAPATFEIAKLDSLMKLEAQREAQIEHARVRARKTLRLAAQKPQISDPQLVQYQALGFYDTSLQVLVGDPFTINPLFSIPSPAVQENKPVFVSSDTASSNTIGKVAYSVDLKRQKTKVEKSISTSSGYGMMTFVVLFSLVVVGFLSLLYKRQLQRIFKSIVSISESQLMYRERNSPLQRASGLMNLLHNTMLALVFTQWIEWKGVSLNGLMPVVIFGGLFVVANAIYAYRFVVSRIIGFLFDLREPFHECFFQMYLYPKALACVLFPIAVFIQFGNPALIEGLFTSAFVLLGVFYMLQTIRTFRVIIKYNVSILFLILYLCAFEIVPVIWVYKLISQVF